MGFSYGWVGVVMWSKRMVWPAALVGVALVGQASVSVGSLVHKLRGGGTIHHRTWPFFDYPMYSRAAGPPISTSTVRLLAEGEDGQRYEVAMHDVGLEYFAFRFNVVERLVADEVGADQPELAALVEEHRREAREKVLSAMAAAGRPRPVRLIVERTIYELDGRAVKDRKVQEVHEWSAAEEGGGR